MVPLKRKKNTLKNLSFGALLILVCPINFILLTVSEEKLKGARNYFFLKVV